MKIGVLHPGMMGTRIAGALTAAGREVVWLPVGRSVESKNRAESINLGTVGSLEEMVRTCGLIISICPPHAAVDVAKEVVGTPSKFDGIYLDANAIAPATAKVIAEIISARGARYLDGSVCGSKKPPAPPRVHISGPDATSLADLLSPLDLDILGTSPTSASAYKMTYASWSKLNLALVLNILAMAKEYEIDEAILEYWNESRPEIIKLLDKASMEALTKGWRWVGEMEEIAETFRLVGLPDGFAMGARDVWKRVPRHKPIGGGNDLSEVIDYLIASGSSES